MQSKEEMATKIYYPGNTIFFGYLAVWEYLNAHKARLPKLTILPNATIESTSTFQNEEHEADGSRSHHEWWDTIL